MFCEKCGAELPQGAAFCPKCGAEQGKTELFQTETTQSSQKPFGAEIERIHFDISDRKTAEPKSRKMPIFFAAGLVVVLIGAVIMLVYSVVGEGNAKKAVKAAMEKTIQTLQEERKEETSNEKQFGYSLEITGEYNRSSDRSSGIEEVLEELGDLRILFYGSLSEDEKNTYGSIEFGAGDMKNIRLNYGADEAGAYLSLPDLYDRSFFIPSDLLEDTTGTDVDELYDQKAREEAFHSLGETLTDIYQELYEKTECTKIGKETLTEHGNVQTTCYEITVLASDYQSYLNSLPDRLEEDQVFMDWLVGISSRQWVNQLLDSLREDIEQYRIPKDIDLIILGDIYVDQQGRVVQLRIPYEDEEKGELVFSFLGEEKLSDYISIRLDMEDDYYTQAVTFRYQVWDEKQMQSVAVDKKNSVSIEEDPDELEAAVIEILRNISDGGYLPSQYMDSLDDLLLSLEMYEDYEGYGYGDYDWEYDLEYSERGNPILKDYMGNYQIELIAPPESDLDLDWSYADQICFTDRDGEQDYYYEIVERSDDTTDRFIFERNYISEENDYKNIVFSDIMQKEINGYRVYYQYCSYDYSFYDSSGCKTYYAWVRLNEEYVFELYLDDYTNSVEDDILDGCFQTVLPVSR